MTFYDPKKGPQTFGIFELTCEVAWNAATHSSLGSSPIPYHTCPHCSSNPSLCINILGEQQYVKCKSSGSGRGCCPNQFKPGLPQAFSVRRGPKKAQVKSSERNTCSFSTQCFPGRSAGSLKISSSCYIPFESARLSALKTHLNKKFQRTKDLLGQISH